MFYNRLINDLYKTEYIELILNRLNINIFEKNIILYHINDIITYINKKLVIYSNIYLYYVLTSLLISFSSIGLLFVKYKIIQWIIIGLLSGHSLFTLILIFCKLNKKILTLFNIINKLNNELYTYAELNGNYNIHSDDLKLFLSNLEQIEKLLNKKTLYNDLNSINDIDATISSYQTNISINDDIYKSNENLIQNTTNDIKLQYIHNKYIKLYDDYLLLLNKNNDLQNKNNDLQNKNNDLQNKNNDLQNKNNDLQNKNNDLYDDNKHLSAINDELKNQNHHLNNNRLITDNIIFKLQSFVYNMEKADENMIIDDTN
jgi:hypothetical protein